MSRSKGESTYAQSSAIIYISMFLLQRAGEPDSRVDTAFETQLDYSLLSSGIQRRLAQSLALLASSLSHTFS